ncbi:MAG: site-specific integrase [Acidobacteria bacterium]|nr:site-specific integrase [Acidobacteriota bacterium]
MAVRKICRPKGCRSSPRCDHPWWFDVMHAGKRWRMRVDEFAFARGATEGITSKQTAERVWEPRFVAEVMAGRDPRERPAKPRDASDTLTVSGLLDRYYASYVEAEGLRSKDTIKGRLKAVKSAIGHLPASALEKTDAVQRFKGAYRVGHAVATLNRALSTLRGAINWARFQEPPLLATSPFHRFGITIRTKDETKRDRRVGAVEEKVLLDAALAIESEEHAWAGASMHDRIIGALETCCRRGEMLRIRNRHVDWERHQIAIPGAHAKDGENRRVPFDPHGRLSAVLKRRAALGPAAFVFGGPDGTFQESFRTAWESLVLRANGHATTRATPHTRVDRATLRAVDLHWHDLRHEGACRLLADGVDIRTIQLMLGHADIKQTQRYLNITDEELRRAMTGVWERRRQLRLSASSSQPGTDDAKASGQ